MHLTGVILDIYDDPTATVLTEKLAGAELPTQLADSELIAPEKLAQMPDRLFALVASNGEDTVRKYAMHDEPHTTTSIIYFLERGHVLPDPTQKVAARNLLTACEWYDMQAPDELRKRAGLLDAGFSALDAKSRAENTVQRTRATMDGFRAAQAGATSDMQKTDTEKRSDLTGTEMMPRSGELSSWPPAKKKHTGGSKNAGWEHAGDLTHYRQNTKVASATKYCLPTEGRYPIDSYEDVKTASAYFDEHVHTMPLDDRREYAVNLSDRLIELGQPVSLGALKYAGHTYGHHIDAELSARIRNYEGTGHEDGYAVLAEKRAMTPPHVMVDMLSELDKVSGASRVYDAPTGFRDPFHAVYGKYAEEKKTWAWSQGNDYINDSLIEDLAQRRYLLLDKVFGMDMRKSFQKNPIEVFTSMPDPQKVVIARLAADDAN